MSAQEPAAFNPREGCPIPYVPQLDLDLVQDCNIPEAPDPIFEAPEMPPFVPPPNIGCPPIQLAMHKRALVQSYNYAIPPRYVKPRPRIPNYAQFSVDINYRDNDYCAPDIDIEVAMPEFLIPCPSMSINFTPTINRGPDSFSVNPYVSYGPDCDFDIDIDVDLSVACTKVSFQKGTQQTWDKDQVDVSITPVGSDPCDLKFKIDAKVPKQGSGGGGNLCIHPAIVIGQGNMVTHVELFLDNQSQFTGETETKPESCIYLYINKDDASNYARYC